MKKLLLLSLFCTAVFADAERVNTEAFFQAAVGAYTVEQIQGVAPHENTAQADVAVDATEAVLTFPYCVEGPNGFCDPGYLFLPLADTVVTQTAAGVDSASYLIAVQEADGRISHYTWELAAGKVTFRNYQYQFPDGTLVTLEHVVSRSAP